MKVLLLTTFLVSLAGSLHCAGMCGGWVALFSGQAKGAAAYGSHLLYHLGRLLAYTTLGLVAGTLGSALDLAAESFAGTQRVAATVGAGIILVWGVFALFGIHKWSVYDKWMPAPLRNVLKQFYQLLSMAPPMIRAFLIGSVSSALPCGWLYAFVICAAGTGGAVDGALLMLAFWGGTVPILLAVGFGFQLLSVRFRKMLPKLSAISLLLIASVSLYTRADLVGQVPGQLSTDNEIGIESSINRVKSQANETPSCCDDGEK